MREVRHLRTLQCKHLRVGMLHKSSRGGRGAKEEAEQSASKTPHAVWGCMHDRNDLRVEYMGQMLLFRRTVLRNLRGLRDLCNLQDYEVKNLSPNTTRAFFCNRNCWEPHSHADSAINARVMGSVTRRTRNLGWYKSGHLPRWAGRTIQN